MQRGRKKKSWLRRMIYLFVFFFVCANGISFMHAYKFTHFTKGTDERLSSTGLTMGETVKALFLGADIPHPENDTEPNVDFETIILENENGKLHAWWMELDSAKGAVAIFHGYGACKSSVLDYGYEFRKMGYNVFMMDTSGSGDSEGNSCTIGHKEAKDAKSAFDFLVSKGSKDILFFGESMGAATILRSIAFEDVKPKAIIIQSPFESMLTATRSRFENMGVPFFGLGHLLVFWGGAQNGFNAFTHSPSEYAKEVDMPTLFFWGAKDDLVRRSETDAVFGHLAGKKELVILENVGHNGHLSLEPAKWVSSVRDFLSGLEN